MRRRGFSIHTVLTLVAVMSFLAATMTALYMASLNFTNSFNNGEIATREAEAGLAELVPQLIRDPLYGTHNEELAGTVTPGVDLTRPARQREVYHVLTFHPGEATVPFSVNRENDAIHQTDFRGQEVAVGTVHVVSTGFCRGQYRSLEAILEHPAYPYGIATKGPLVSLGSVRVVGTTTISDTGEYVEDRPGHVASNSNDAPAAVRISGGQTYISGHVRAVGNILVPSDADIPGGVLEHSSPVVLPRFRWADFEPTPDFREVQFDSSDVYQEARLNSAYVCHGNLHLHRGLTFANGLLRVVGGNLTVDDHLEGTGAIVCDGNLTLHGGASQLQGTSWIALCARGDLTIDGGQKNIRGMVYTEGNLTASHIVIAGASIANPASGSPASGGATLDHVTLISHPTALNTTLTVIPSPGSPMSPAGPIPYGTRVQGDVIDLNDIGGGTGVTRAQAQQSLDQLMNVDMLAHRLTISPYDVHQPPFSDPRAQNAIALLAQLNILAHAVIDANEGVGGNPPPDDPSTPNDDRNDYWVARQSAAMTAYSDFRGQAQNAFMDFVGQAPDVDGSVPLDPSRPPLQLPFDVNQFLPRSERYRIGYWHLHPRLLRP